MTNGKRYMTNGNISVLFVAVLVLLLPLTAVHAASQTGIIVPLYVYPSGSGLTAWQTVASLASSNPSIPVVAVINPDSGPGTARDPAFTSGISLLRSANIKVLGYVYTSWGTRSVASAEADINVYHSWYNVNGIIFDEMAASAGKESYYSTITAYAHSLGYSPVFGNPGTIAASSYYGTVDNMVIYESAGLPSGSYLAAATYNYPSAYSFVAFAVSTLDAAAVRSLAPAVSYLYVTDDNLPNPWDSIASYLSSLFAALSGSTAPTGYFTINGQQVSQSSTITVSSALLTFDGYLSSGSATSMQVAVKDSGGNTLSTLTLSQTSGNHYGPQSYTLPSYGTYTISGSIESTPILSIVGSWLAPSSGGGGGGGGGSSGFTTTTSTNQTAGFQWPSFTWPNFTLPSFSFPSISLPTSGISSDTLMKLAGVVLLFFLLHKAKLIRWSWK